MSTEHVVIKMDIAFPPGATAEQKQDTVERFMKVYEAVPLQVIDLETLDEVGKCLIVAGSVAVRFT